jgi:hypothetical protein
MTNSIFSFGDRNNFIIQIYTNELHQPDGYTPPAGEICCNKSGLDQMGNLNWLHQKGAHRASLYKQASESI